MKQNKSFGLLAIFLVILSIAGQAVACENSAVEEKYPYLAAAKQLVKEHPDQYSLNENMVRQYKNDIDSSSKKLGTGTSDLTPDAMIIEKEGSKSQTEYTPDNSKTSSSKSKKFGLVDNVYNISIDIAQEDNNTGRFITHIPDNASLILTDNKTSWVVKNVSEMKYFNLSSGSPIHFLIVQETKNGKIKPLYAHVLYPRYNRSAWELNNREIYANSPTVNKFIDEIREGKIEKYDETPFKQFANKEVSKKNATLYANAVSVKNNTSNATATTTTPKGDSGWMNNNGVIAVFLVLLLVASLFIFKSRNYHREIKRGFASILKR